MNGYCCRIIIAERHTKYRFCLSEITSADKACYISDTAMCVYVCVCVCVYVHPWVYVSVCVYVCVCMRENNAVILDRSMFSLAVI